MKRVLLRSVVAMRCRACAPPGHLDASSMQPITSGCQRLKHVVCNGSNNLGSRLVPRAVSCINSSSCSSVLLPMFSGQLATLSSSCAARLWPSQHSRHMQQLQHVRCASTKASSKAKTMYRCSECGSGELCVWSCRKQCNMLRTHMFGRGPQRPTWVASMPGYSRRAWKHGMQQQGIPGDMLAGYKAAVGSQQQYTTVQHMAAHLH